MIRTLPFIYSVPFRVIPPTFDNVSVSVDGDLKNIDKPSADNEAMSPYWKLVDTILEGVDAMRNEKSTYLPKFPHEQTKDYDFRAKSSTMTNVYRDIVEGLASKPFAKEAHVETDSASETVVKLQENIDGRGNHLHVFLAETFFRGINAAIHWILVDYPTMPVDPEKPRTQAEESALGVRPYWVQVHGKDVLEVQSKIVGGNEVISYIRLLEMENGVPQVRVFDCRTGPRVDWRVYRKDEQTKQWALHTDGSLTIDRIPMVPFFVGRRKGTSWQFIPPMRDTADLQVELYQQETGLKHAKIRTCFPMLAGNGITPEKEGNGPNAKVKALATGPGAVLYAPSDGNGGSGSWQILEPGAASLKFLADDRDKLIERMREQGRQPLTAQSGNVTRISAAYAATKSNSAVQAWALDLKDAAEQAMMITELWLRETGEPEIFVFTDFKVETDDNSVPTTLLAMRTNKDLSQKTLWSEMQNNGVLGSNFDPDAEEKALAEEYPSGDGNLTPEEIAAAAI